MVKQKINDKKNILKTKHDYELTLKKCGHIYNLKFEKRKKKTNNKN